ncbi:MAG: GldG family protein [Planctomycetes bacterium]|nr:GldG family protein [Planctomycetota bacterium]
MNPSARRALVATALLGVAAVLALVRAFDAFRLPKFDLEHTGLVRLDPRAERAMRELDADVIATLVLSDAAEFVAAERGLGEELVERLERLAAASGGRFTWQRVDPARNPELADWVAGQGVRPFSLREVRADAFAERSVFGALVLSYGAHGKRVIPALSRARLDGLELLIAEELAELVRPTRPKVVLAGSAPTALFAAELARSADVVRIDLDGGAEIPRDAVLVCWLGPTIAGDAPIAELSRALDRGTSVVLAGGGLTDDGRLEPSGRAVRELAAQFGARVSDEIVRDDSPVSASANAVLESALAVASIASDQDFRLLGAQPNGTLAFRAPQPVETDAEKLVELGLEARVLASSGPRAWRSAAAESLGGADASVRRGRAPLALQLAPRDGWRGTLAVFGSSSPFEDRWLAPIDFAHRNLAHALVGALADPSRIARVRAHVRGAEPLPELAPGARFGWRGFVILAVPLVLFGIALARGSLVSLRAFGSGRELLSLGIAGALVVLVGLGGSAAQLAPSSAGVDVTSERIHTLAPRSLAIARELAQRGAPVQLELFVDTTLPPRIQAAVGRVRALIADLAAEGAPLELVRRLPDTLDAAEREALARTGVVARAVETRDETAATVRAVWAALRVGAGERTSVVDLTSVDGDSVAEFRLVLALERALGRPAPKLALAADTPRLSAAEARELYEAKQLFAPTETDVYSQAERWLADNGFDVVRVEPSSPVMPRDVAGIVWLQPRRDVTPMLATVATALAEGKGVVLAAQHFLVQSRRLDTRRGELAHWPRPQYCDLERGWLADLGLELVREVLCDTSSTVLDVATEVGSASAARELAFAASAEPFVLRALPENFAEAAPIVRGLSDLRLPYANRWRVDAAKLARHGLRAEPLVRTSADAWAVAWQGGDLAPDALVRPETTLGRVELALDVRGHFPRADGSEGAAEGRAVLIGCSETFKNGQLFDPEWRAADFLLAATAAVVLGDDHAAILAQRPRRAGFAAPTSSERIGWRAVVVLAGPLAVLLCAFVMRRLAARAVPGAVA